MALIENYARDYRENYARDYRVNWMPSFDRRGTMDFATTRILSIHVAAFLPPTSTELNVPHNVQVAAILGIGLVYQGTAHRHTSEVLLSEIGNFSQCQIYLYWDVVLSSSTPLFVYCKCGNLHVWGFYTSR